MRLPKQPVGVNRPEQVTDNREVTVQRFLESRPTRIIASKDETDDARLVANLIDDSASFLTMTYSLSSQRAFLEHVIDTFFEGKSAHLAMQLGVDKSQLHGWTHGRVRMSLPRLVSVARCCCCEIADILLGEQVAKHFHPLPEGQRSRIVSQVRRGAETPLTEIRKRLRKLIETKEVSDASAASNALNISRKFLRKHFREENALLVKRGEETRRASRRETTEAFARAYLVEHQALVDDGIYPTRRLVLARVDVEVHGRLKHRKVQLAKREAHLATGTPIALHGDTPILRPRVDKK
ncbi:hypothetical protein [Paraburkholderia mimosarum]|nr:hypothetical protein [Paraburkholderia mimosarum]